MSLVPYSSRDSREIVLRHDDAIVIRDPQSKQLILRGTSTSSNLTDCPYCHQPIRQQPAEESREPRRNESFVSPEYFRMLHLATNEQDEDQHPPSSPIRRLVQPAFPSPGQRTPDRDNVAGAEFVASTPVAPDSSEGLGIKRDAFSPNYFKKFFIEEKELGRGGKGVVLLVKHELDGVFLGHFACKRVPVGDDHAWLEKVLIEVQLLQRLSHPNLVSYRHVWLEDVKLNRFSPSVPCAFILQQYCNAGDLLHYVIGKGTTVIPSNEHLKQQLRRRSKGQAEKPQDLKSSQRKLQFEEIYSFFKDITSGLAHLHASNYIHRDLKPSNCLLHKDGNEFSCLISDFGEVQAENVARKSTGATGTISYCAPEVLRQDSTGRFGNFTAKSDIFSLGMILYFMCFGRLPYSSAENIQEEFEDLDQLRAEISTWSGFQEERQERPELPAQLYDFLKRLLAIDPAERPTASEILLAINKGSGLESPPRAGRKNSGLADLVIGKRIQPVDSPAPSVQGRSGRRVRSHAHLEDDAGDGDESIGSGTAEHFSIPIPPPDAEAQMKRRDQSKSPQTPLLMAPPSTRISDFQHQLAIYRHQAYSWMVVNRVVLVLAGKMFLFIAKIFALTKPCLPLASSPFVLYPLLLLAAFDFGLGMGIPLRLTGILAAIHFMVVFVLARRGSLCTGSKQLWEWDG